MRRFLRDNGLSLFFLGLFHLHLSRVLFEEGERPGLAGIGGNNRIAVEVVDEFDDAEPLVDGGET